MADWQAFHYSRGTSREARKLLCRNKRKVFDNEGVAARWACVCVFVCVCVSAVVYILACLISKGDGRVWEVRKREVGRASHKISQYIVCVCVIPVFKPVTGGK